MRVMVAEDEYLVAMELERILTSMDIDIVGPAVSVAEAMEISSRERFDGAILDINLRGEHVFPVAAKLVADKVPVILTSGYEVRMIPDRFRTLPILSKPYSVALLQEAFKAAGLAGAPPGRTLRPA